MRAFGFGGAGDGLVSYVGVYVDEGTCRRAERRQPVYRAVVSSADLDVNDVIADMLGTNRHIEEQPDDGDVRL